VGVGWLVDEGCAGWGWYGELIGEGLLRVGVCSRTFLWFVCVCECVYVGVQVYVYVYMRVCMCAWVCVCMCTSSHEYYLVCPCVGVFICIPTTSREWESVRDMKRERESFRVRVREGEYRVG
jgi:hypothetical protein